MFAGLVIYICRSLQIGFDVQTKAGKDLCVMGKFHTKLSKKVKYKSSHSKFHAIYSF